MKYYQQFDMTDCGAACLAMIASHFGKTLSIADIRKSAGTDIIGTNIKGLVDAAKKYGLNAYPVKGTMESIKTKVEVPFICHMHIERDENEWKDHYVVVKKLSSKKIEIWDPDGMYGKRRISYDDFSNYWTGYAIFIEPGPLFTKTEKKESFLLQFFQLFIPHKKNIVYSILSSFLLIVMGVAFSFFYKYLFDEVIFIKSNITLITVILGMLIISCSQKIISFVKSCLLAHVSYKTDLQLSFSYLSHIFKLPIAFFESRKTGEILSRFTDLEKVRTSIMSTLLSCIMDIAMISLSVPILIHINKRLFIVSFLTILLVALVCFVFAKIYRNYYSKVLASNAEVQSFLYESINGVATVKALNSEDWVNNNFIEKKMKVNKVSWNLNHIGISQNLIDGLINTLSTVLLYFIGCNSIINGEMSVGTLFAFNALSGYFTGPLFRIVNMQTNIQEAYMAARRVGEILELEHEGAREGEKILPSKLSGHIVFDDVTFAYGSRKPVYEHLSLEIPAGSWTAFVGSSGSGKSTFVKLLMKFYEAKEGRILLDGNDIRDIDTCALRGGIGYVPQDIFLFSGTIRENIALHKPEASLEDVIEAAKKSRGT